MAADKSELRQLAPLLGLKFRRQHPAGPYFLDFACPSKMLAVELDGAGHLTRVTEDQIRDEWLADQGWLVLRFGNHQVVCELEAVLETIVSVAGRR